MGIKIKTSAAFSVRVRRICATVAIAALVIVSQQNQLGAQATLDVIAPVASRTLVDVAGIDGAQYTLRTNGFKGRAEIQPESSEQRHVLVLEPELTATRVDIDVLRNGSYLRTFRVLPVAPNDAPTAVDSLAAAPDPASRDYTIVTQTPVEFTGRFNGQQRQKLRKITVSGYRVVIRPGESQGVYERLTPGGRPAEDIHTLEIYAREVVIGAALELPGTTVRIFAQRLRFEDAGPTRSFISTTPRATSPATTQGAPGATGERGGDIFLNVETFDDALDGTRFIATGGVGQQGGTESEGPKVVNLPMLATDGPSAGQIGGIVRSWNEIPKVFHGPLPPRWEVYETPKNVVWFNRYGKNEFGERDQWPKDGNPGIPGGVPGVGGDGGTLHTTIGSTASTVMVSDGGLSGAPRPPGPGSQGGGPSHAVGIYLELRFRFPSSFDAVYHFYSRISSPGPSVPSPSAAQPRGASGTHAADLRGWLHPTSARAILAYAEDLYRLGFLTRARTELSFLASAIASDEAITDASDEYVMVRHRVEALLARLSSNLDYFGNPAGWVPALDFPTTLKLLETEVARSAPILFVTEQIRLQAAEGMAQGAAVRQSRDTAVANISQFNDRLSSLADLIPQLQAEASVIAQQEAVFLRAVQDQEAALARAAQDLANPKPSFLQQALKTIATVAKVIPVATPILQAAGGALDFLATVDQRTPWENITQLPSVVKGFNEESLKASVAQYKTVVADVSARLDTLDPKQPKAFFNEIKGAAELVGGKIAEFKKIQEASRAPADKVDAIFQRLKASDPSLREFVQRASDLSARKALLGRSIDRAMNELGELQSQIGSMVANVDALNSELVDAQDWVDHPGVLAAQNVSRLLRERLDYYHYLVIKAYEYYSARPYAGNRRGAATAEALLEVLRRYNNDPAAAARAYEATYVEEIRGVGRQIVQRLAEEGPGRQKTVTLVLNATELAELNRMLKPEGVGSSDLFIDLENRGIIPVSDLEARLVKVEVSRCDCEQLSGGSGNMQIDVAPAPGGVIIAKDRKLGFRQTEGANGWSASIDLTTGPSTVYAVTEPEDVGQVLATLLNMPALQRYSTAPPALPGVSMRVRLFTAGAAEARMTTLHLRLTYSYRSAPNTRAVRVVTRDPDGGKAFFYVSAPDASGRQHGYGDFTRMFEGAGAVEITAPTMLGRSRFAGWSLNSRIVQTSTRLSVPTTADSYFYEAQYEPPTCNYSVTPASVSLPAAASGVTITVTTDAGCAWSASGSGFVTVASGGSGAGSGTVILSAAANSQGNRTVTLTIAGRPVTVTQAGISTAKRGKQLDFNGDGLADLLWQHQTDGRLAGWLMNGPQLLDGTLLTPGQVADTTWKLAGSGDLDGDGEMDLVWQNTADGRIAAWMMNGLRQRRGELFSIERVPDTNWRIHSVADFDGDGRADLFWQHHGDGRIAVWRMDGLTVLDGVFLTPSQVTDTNWRIAGTADFDGNGSRDLVWRHETDGRVAIWLMNGTTLMSGTLTTPAQVPDTNWKIRAVTDLNTDGHPDLVWQHAADGRLAVWLMNGVNCISGLMLTPSQVPDINWHIVGPR